MGGCVGVVGVRLQRRMCVCPGLRDSMMFPLLDLALHDDRRNVLCALDTVRWMEFPFSQTI
jgi:hypothetical protein